jgi:hypothetical protein
MNRIAEPEKTNETEMNGSEYLTTIFTGIITTMRQLPNDHFVWNYSDPTRTYYVLGLDEDKIGTNPLELFLRPHHNKTLTQFLDWYEGQLMVTHEIRQTIYPVHTEWHLPVESVETATSSTQMESSSSEPITWGATQVRNQAEELRKWEETPTHEVADKKDTTSDAKTTLQYANKCNATTHTSH